MKAIEPPPSIIVTKCWVDCSCHKPIPSALRPKAGCLYYFWLSRIWGNAEIDDTSIAEILEAVGDILKESSSFDFLVRLRSNMVLDAEDINQLNGDAYELIVETAGGESGWRKCMEPVTKNGSPQIFWVSRDVSYDTSNGYAIVQVG